MIRELWRAFCWWYWEPRRRHDHAQVLANIKRLERELGFLPLEAARLYGGSSNYRQIFRLAYYTLPASATRQVSPEVQEVQAGLVYGPRLG